MLGTSPLATILSAKHGTIGDVASVALRAGFAIVLDQHDSKIPVCILSDRARKLADADAVNQAVVDGRPSPHRATHPCGARHALHGDVAARAVRALVARLEQRHGQLNLGIEPGASRLVVVDVDTAEERRSFEDWCRRVDIAVPEITVRSPGKRTDGEWVHQDGGHYWFSLPSGVDLSDHGGGVLKIDQFSVVWSRRQILIPPSVRSEGAYVYTGAPISEVPLPLLDAIRAHSDQHAARMAARVEWIASSDPTSIDNWDARTSWAAVLVPLGWTDTGKVDTSCGAICAIWTAPGTHGTAKSATAHADGCSLYTTPHGWGPLHIWTDTPPEPLIGGSTVTKLTVLAAANGLTRAEQMTELGIGGEDLVFQLDPFSAMAPAVTTPDPFSAPPPALDTVPEPFSDPAADDTPDVAPAAPSGIITHTLSDMRHRGERAPDLVAGILGDSGLSRVIGKSNEGKTFVAVDLAACVATGHSWNHRAVQAGKVFYVNYEDNDGLMDRFLAWDAAHDGLLGQHEDNLHIVDPISDVFISELSVASRSRRNEFARMIRDQHARLVIFDTQSMATVGVDENDSTAMTQAVMWLKQIVARVPHCQLMLIHHRGHNGEHGRGSTAVYAAMDTELSVERPDKDRPEIIVTTTKQRAMAFAPEVTVTLATIAVDGLRGDQAYIAHSDPFETPKPSTVVYDPELTLPDGADWAAAVLAAIGAELTDRDELGFTATEIKTAVLGLGGLPAVKRTGKRTELSVQKSRISTQINKLLRQGVLARMDGKTGTFELTDRGLDRAETARESCAEKVHSQVHSQDHQNAPGAFQQNGHIDDQGNAPGMHP